MRPWLRKFLTVSVPAIGVTLLLFAGLVEVWVRVSWNPLRGTPGLFVADARRVERLAPNYSGWYAGVPIRINNLGFRDTRDYRIERTPRTFRILVFGNSVTFGTGGVYEYTYPYLLEERLKRWKPDVDWQVWNLGVPGYDTGHVRAYLEEVGPVFQPDVTFVGFSENDFTGNAFVPAVTRGRLAATRVKQFLKARFYSFELYKAAYLQLSWRLSSSEASRQLAENLSKEEAMLARVEAVRNLKEQTPSPFERLDSRPSITSRCERQPPDPGMLTFLKRYSQWLINITALQDLHRQGAYRLAFFLNLAPDVCEQDDLFYYGRSRPPYDHLMEAMARGTPAVSAYESFYRTRPSQMPFAGGHGLGNSNVVKAEALFQFLVDAFDGKVPAMRLTMPAAGDPTAVRRSGGAS